MRKKGYKSRGKKQNADVDWLFLFLSWSWLISSSFGKNNLFLRQWTTMSIVVVLSSINSLFSLFVVLEISFFGNIESLCVSSNTDFKVKMLSRQGWTFHPSILEKKCFPHLISPLIPKKNNLFPWLLDLWSNVD